jgi:hypothetical protein
MQGFACPDITLDSETLYAHMDFWGQEDKPTSAELLRLNPKETALYDDLRYNRIRPALRLEQEYIGFECLRRFEPYIFTKNSIFIV